MHVTTNQWLSRKVYMPALRKILPSGIYIHVENSFAIRANTNRFRLSSETLGCSAHSPCRIMYRHTQKPATTGKPIASLNVTLSV
jgi:hypothetical protein